ncbi:hypothetical protein Y1Q_0022975 [Alligator mississippiensis]|uniref:Uncharacterized protein n=1 Tax=Alligator mississippiensis TaxID=8496 RepID=A0A151P7E2_ALLMI|nr:hypothetical protein Y1Q_0022975 [Alligator mississippiensis]
MKMEGAPAEPPDPSAARHPAACLLGDLAPLPRSSALSSVVVRSLETLNHPMMAGMEWYLLQVSRFQVPPTTRGS